MSSLAPPSSPTPDLTKPSSHKMLYMSVLNYSFYAVYRQKQEASAAA